ncbi:sensor histidine kinase [Staphylococcus delphini]|uniref:histidine kinase n=1 Tax=Staphylococcus delphini TaxID=53344 RepID=A0AAQ0IG12_9STAP|nr:sensor histidine kinase [Staphylococcus delphini]QUM66631.1 sensor histidine kinase [Staphylococcus delphini]QUM69071.1 sensor histidine kinase [Staphylococcus delphini]
MIKSKWLRYFLRERLAWILMFVVFDVIVLGFGFLDDALPLNNLWYVIGVKWIVSVFFLVQAYLKETRFYMHLETFEEIEVFLNNHLAETPFERVTVTYLRTKMMQLKQAIGEQQHRIDLNEQSLTEFIHDIKTPVTALKLLIEKEDDHARKQQLMYEWSRIDYMLDQHLFLARLHHQAHDMYFEAVPLRALMVEEIRQTRHIAMHKGIGFNVDIAHKTKVYTDKRWMRMVLRQILSNAIKYSEEADIDVFQTCEDGHIQLHIRDYGVGIAPHDMPRIFQRGFAAQNGPAVQTSSGMGLYLVEAVREALGFQIHVTSVVDEGTTVTIDFPKQNDYLVRMSK